MKLRAPDDGLQCACGLTFKTELMVHIGADGMHTSDPLSLKVVHEDLLRGATAVTVDIGRDPNRKWLSHYQMTANDPPPPPKFASPLAAIPLRKFCGKILEANSLA